MACFLAVAVLSLTAAAEESHAPRIAGVETLTESSALLWWDSVDASVTRIQVMINEHPWGPFQARGECAASRGWIVVNSLQTMRHYRFALQAETAEDSLAAGPVFEYSHSAPPVEWVFIPGRDCDIGDSLDPLAGRHTVHLDSYLISATEITNREYLNFCATDSAQIPEDPGFVHLRDYIHHYPDYPVVDVSWFDATRCCNGLSRQLNLPECYDERGTLHANRGVRLPTEAEWEHAARPALTEYPWGNALPSPAMADYDDGRQDTTVMPRGPVAVRSYPASPSGIYDMTGNVWEWCEDWYAPYDQKLAVTVNPAGPASGIYKVVRGGSWADPATALRSAARQELSPSAAMSTVGFRVARSFPVSSPQVIERPHAEEQHAPSK